MEKVLEQLALALVLAAIAEGSVEYFFKPLVDWVAEKIGVDSDTRYVGAAAGIGLCFAYQLDILDAAGYEAIADWIGILLTGILVGRGSNFFNDFVTRYILVNPLEK